MSARDIAVFTFLVALALIAGLMYGWVVSVIPGHRRLDDRSYLHAMQQINRAIVNPGFLVLFIGSAVLGGAAAVLQYRTGDSRRWLWLAGATAVYVVGMLGVTAGGNIPLNNEVDALDLDRLSREGLASARADYEGPWNRRHNIRTVAGVVAFSMAGIAAMLGEGADG